MNEDYSFNFFPVFVLCGVLSGFFIFAYLFLKRRKMRHSQWYAGDLLAFQKAVIDQDVQAINFYGDRIIWNEFLEQSDKKKIYEAVEPMVELNPELVQLWKDVHYKTHGYDPPWNDATDSEWASNKAFTSSKVDILDQ